MRYIEIYEAVSSRIFHYTRVHIALKILTSGEFELASTVGDDAESHYAPKGYPYFLSTTRTRFGGYHTGVSGDAVLFELDGDYYNKRYPGGPVDYYKRRSPDDLHGRVSEAEDRIFSKDNTIPAAIVSMDVWVDAKEKIFPEIKARARKLLLMGKTQGIPTRFFTDDKAWRQGNDRLQGDVSILVGQERTGITYPVKRKDRSLLPWIELIKAKDQSQLSPEADKIRYNVAYRDPSLNAEILSVDMSNSRKPNSQDRGDVVKIINYMQANRMNTVVDLVNNLRAKWSLKQ